MRDFKGMKRQRGRNRGGGGPQGGGKPQHNINRAFDSNGPDNIKVRGNAQHVYEKYQALARDAALAGDRVLAENHLQHAEHYFRTLRAIQPTRAASEIVSRDTSSNGDIDFEDEAVETAMEEADAQAAARAADALNQPQNAGLGQPQDADGAGETPRFDQGQQNQRREWRPQNEFRDRNDRPFNNDRQDRPQGEFRDRQNADRQNGQNQGVPQNGEFRDRQDRGDRPRFRDRDDRYRDRQDRDASQGGGDRQDRPQGEFRGDRPNANQGGPNQGGPNQGGQGQNGQGQNPRGEPRGDRDRGDRPRFRERDDRRFEPREAEAAPAAGSEAAALPLPQAVRDEPAAVLRSEDGGVSQLPGFLQPPAPAAATVADGSEEAERPRRPRRRRTREEGDTLASAPEVEEV